MKSFNRRKFLVFLAIITVFISLTVFCASAETEGIFTYSVANDEATLTKVDYTGVKDIVIPETLGGYPVTELGDHCLKDDDSTLGEEADSVFIPKTVTSVNKSAFQDSDIKCIIVDEKNPALSSDDFGVLYNKDKTVLFNAPSAFASDNYTVPSSVKSIREWAFHTCILLEEFTIPGTVENVGEAAFFHCLNMRKLTIEDGVKQLGDAHGCNVFAWCYALEEVRIPASLGVVAASAFTECYALESIVIPEGITEIQWCAFEYCPALKRVYLPSTLTTLVKGAFGNCTALTDICYAGSAEDWANVSIDTSPYAGSSPVVIDTCNIHYNISTEAYKDLTFENDNDILTFSGGGSIPGGWHYWDADKDTVTTVFINGDIRSVEEGAFADCPELTTVVFDTETTAIAGGAFANCPNLQAVFCHGGSSFGSGAFGFDGTCKVYENADKVHALGSTQGNLTVVPYRFADGALSLLGDVSFESYEFFDTMAAFSLQYDDIQKLTFTSFSFDEIPLYFYPIEGKSTTRRVEDNTLINGEMYPLIYEDDAETPITFNRLVAGIADKSIEVFYLISSDEAHQQIKDTPIVIENPPEEEEHSGDSAEDDEDGGIIGVIRKAMRWVITLLNALFKILGKK